MRRATWLFASSFLLAFAVTAFVGCPNSTDLPPSHDSGVCVEYDFGLSETSDAGPDAETEADVAEDEADAVVDAPSDVDDVSDTTSDADETEADVTTTPNDAPKVCRKDVEDILFLSCAFSTCHGESPTGQKGLYIDKTGARDWYPFIVNAQSTERPDLVRVAPGDPRKSWLAHKLVGDQCAFPAFCADHDCGDQMPATGQPLNDSDLTTILEWIRQGADPDPTCGGTR